LSTTDNKRGKIVLKKKWCIGSYSTVLLGAIIDKNAVIYAHSFVPSDLPENCLAVGVPTTVINERPDRD